MPDPHSHPSLLTRARCHLLQEFASFNHWLGRLRQKFRYIVVITGSSLTQKQSARMLANICLKGYLKHTRTHPLTRAGNHDCRHDVRSISAHVASGAGAEAAVAAFTDPQWVKKQLPAATHVLVHEEVALTR